MKIMQVYAQTRTQTGADVTPQGKPPAVRVFTDARGGLLQGQVLQIPTTHEEMMALMSQRDQLKDQLEEVTDRRNEIIGQLRSHPPEAAQASLQSELKVLDQRVTELHNDLSLVGREISRASPDLIAMATEQPPAPGFVMPPPFSGPGNFEDGVMLGAGVAIFAMTVLLLVGRFIWKRFVRSDTAAPRALRADSERLQRLEQGMEAVAIEVERISEGQRYVTKLLSESRGLESTPR
ncbi:MAG TPA: hypothetical protein VJ840_04540 [Gemmatimonadaceae bacterium]|nr:hypothetical protein [Gemmatimonadaceae bacterium]